MSLNTSRIAPGTVWLVGAGPGDPELLTRKAERLLQDADVVFYDALVGKGVLDLIPSKSRLVPVGKRSGRHSKDQKTIDQLIVEAALTGERVVRLKGGDPSIFGRSAEEIAACSDAGIPVEICPGITTASAASASLKASLTLRGLARKLTFVTAHARRGETLDLDWKTLADPKVTLAVYMGKAAAAPVSSNLIREGLPASTPVALIENVSLPNEQVIQSRLDILPILAKSTLGQGPAIILIGAAVASEGSVTKDTIDAVASVKDKKAVQTAP